MPTQRTKRSTFSILILLLFCLCCSRGEGIHLFPFESPTAAADSAETSPGTSYYETSNSPKATTTKQSNKKRENAPPALTFVPDILEDQLRIALRELAFCTVQPSKFDRTSSSDRSPPMRA